MSADILFQYQAFAEPFVKALGLDATVDEGETITLDKWYQEYTNPVRRRRFFPDGFVVLPFPAALAQSVTSLDEWWKEPADVMRRKKGASPWLYAAPFTETLPPPPVAPDLPFPPTSMPPFRHPFWPPWMLVEVVEPIQPVQPQPNVSDNTWSQWLIPLIPSAELGKLPRTGHAINRVVRLINSLIRQGKLTVRDIDSWDYSLSSANVTDALGFTPTIDPTHEVTTITNNGSGVPIVTTTDDHGLVAGDLITIVGTSVDDYNGDWEVDTAPTTATFTFAEVGGPVASYVGDATGGTWRMTATASNA